MPFKRYVQGAVLQRSGDYLGNDRHSYRQAARDGRLPIGYETEATAAREMGSSIAPHATAPAAIDERRLSPVTIWRWVGWLGARRRAVRTALELIRQKEPHNTLHRQVCAVPPHKYRSPARRTLLEHALRLLLTAAVFRRLFATELFPYFATAPDDG